MIAYPLVLLVLVWLVLWSLSPAMALGSMSVAVALLLFVSLRGLWRIYRGKRRNPPR